MNDILEAIDEDIHDETNVFEDLMFDSIGIIELIVHIEECFHIEFDDDIMISTFSSVKNIIDYVDNKLLDK